MCEILCEPLSSKCSADKSLTWIFYSWRPSRNGYHFRNSPCANTSCSVSLVPCVLGRCHQRSFCQPLHHISWLFLQSKMFWAHLQVGMGLHCCFLKKNVFNYYYFCHPFLWKQRASHRRAAIDTRKWKESQILTARWNPIESGENQGLIWSKCPQVQTIWQPESDGFTKTIIHHFSPVSNQLAGLLWAAAPLHTMFDTLMDNGETLPPYGKKILHDLESFLLLFFPVQTLTKKTCGRCETIPAQTSEKTVAELIPVCKNFENKHWYFILSITRGVGEVGFYQIKDKEQAQ